MVSSSGLKPKYLWFPHVHVADAGCTWITLLLLQLSFLHCSVIFYTTLLQQHAWKHLMGPTNCPTHYIPYCSTNYSTAPPTAPTAPTAALLWLPARGKFLFPISIKYQASAQSLLSKSAIHMVNAHWDIMLWSNYLVDYIFNKLVAGFPLSHEVLL